MGGPFDGLARSLDMNNENWEGASFRLDHGTLDFRGSRGTKLRSEAHMQVRSFFACPFWEAEAEVLRDNPESSKQKR
jgi:hypothetical protein